MNNQPWGRGPGFFSIHRYPFYPGTGAADETGSGAGLGSNLNVPISIGTSRLAYLEQFNAGLESLARKLQPELVIISAGFDHRRYVARASGKYLARLVED